MYHKMSDFYSKELIEACKPYENVKFEEEWEEKEAIKEIQDDSEYKEWIPVSERLPEEHKDVLIDIKEGKKHTFHVTHLVDVNYWVRLGRDVNVVAWMPLPEPYKADMRGGEE